MLYSLIDRVSRGIQKDGGHRIRWARCARNGYELGWTIDHQECTIIGLQEHGSSLERVRQVAQKVAPAASIRIQTDVRAWMEDVNTPVKATFSPLFRHRLPSRLRREVSFPASVMRSLSNGSRVIHLFPNSRLLVDVARLHMAHLFEKNTLVGPTSRYRR